jgi:hypothetical protein
VNRQQAGLPYALTSFVGRERERTEIAAALRTARLLSLVGFGGVGKTRLALMPVCVVRMQSRLRFNIVQAPV